jgi:ribokinase
MDAGSMREGYRELASHVDVLIASEGFADPLAGRGASPEKAVEALSEWGPKQIVVTLGVKGSLGWGGGGFVFQKAFSIRAVDTTGAGDVYHGAYIYGLLRGWEMSRCMLFASVAAALKCRHTGARRGIPSLSEVEEFISENI